MSSWHEVIAIIYMFEYPRIFRVRQKLEAPCVADVASEVSQQLLSLSLEQKIKPGQSVAIAVGSRGIARISHIVKAIVDHIKDLGAEPFIVPAMGSHGGAAADGQQKVLESYGITEESCGCSIRSSMDTVELCRAAEGFAVHFDRNAYEADHVVVCNRIKSHTMFRGQVESGLLKMLLIGLGKHTGAKIYHRAIQDYSFERILHSVTNEVLAKCSVIAGVAIIENAYGRTAAIEAVPPERFAQREKVLLAKARKWAPRLPFTTADVLLIDEIGKHISGTGLDLPAVGRKYLDHKAAEDEYPKIRMIALRNLSAASHGNAIGIGSVEFCRTRLLEKMDVESTRVNVLTSGHYTAAMIPLDYSTDRQMLEAMLGQIGLTEPPDAKLLWVRNTLAMAEVECSAAYLDEARSRADLEILTDLRPLPFDPGGNLLDEHMDHNLS